MNAIVCVDANLGVGFNHRRQSQDRILRQRLLELAGGTLWMNAYSAKQFGLPLPERIRVKEDFWSAASPGDFCFAECEALDAQEAKIHRLILFRWNRVYPSDQWLGLDLTRGWHLVQSQNFAGYSHEKITQEIYEK